MKAATGRQEEAGFVYFLYHAGLYPVATDNPSATTSGDGAMDVIEKHGHSLLTELGHSSRFGDLGRAFCYLPYVWLRGDPSKLTLRPFHAAVFVVALMALFASCWWCRQPLLGGLLVGLLGSNPFQLYEAYFHENYFGWPISTCVLALAASFPLFGRSRIAVWYPWLSAVAIGLMLSTVRQIRSEAVVTLAASVGVFLFTPRQSWAKRIGLLATLLGSFVLASIGWSTFFAMKVAEAERVVSNAGGKVYRGPRDSHHMFWHPMWCGLGDHDDTHGYSWDDRVAASFAHPHLVSRWEMKLPQFNPDSYSYPGLFWPESERYYVLPYELPHYDEVVREKVLGDIAADPAWYLSILLKRVVGALAEVTPVTVESPGLRISLGTQWFMFPVVLALLSLWRNPILLRSVLFCIPLSMPAVLVYSGRGMTYFGCQHVVATGVGMFILISAFLRLGKSVRRTTSTPPPSSR